MKRLLATAIGLLLLLTGCGSTPSSEVKGDNTGETTTPTTQSTGSGGASPDPAEEGTTATFKVTTTTKASVTWGTGSGMSQDEIKKGTWTKEVKLDDTFDVATLTVTSGDYMKSQTVTCEILLNGVSKAKNKSKGKLSIANCTANTTD